MIGRVITRLFGMSSRSGLTSWLTGLEGRVLSEGISLEGWVGFEVFSESGIDFELWKKENDCNFVINYAKIDIA